MLKEKFGCELVIAFSGGGNGLDDYFDDDSNLKEEYRGRGLASKLFRERERLIKEKGYNFVLVRTTRKSDIPFKWYLKLGFEVVFEYNDQQDRVILVKKI